MKTYEDGNYRDDPRDLQSRLAKGERGIPKIPDSPDTRHAVAAPPAAEGQAPPLRLCSFCNVKMFRDPSGIYECANGKCDGGRAAAPIAPPQAPCGLGCKHSDAWKCAVARRMTNQIACRCECHSYLKPASAPRPAEQPAQSIIQRIRTQQQGADTATKEQIAHALASETPIHGESASSVPSQQSPAKEEGK